MPFPTSDPIALEIKARSQEEIARILTTWGIMMQNETKAHILVINDDNDRVRSIYDLGGSPKYVYVRC
jgi:hypothetical protein